MASIKQKTDKAGNVVYQVQASDGRGRRVWRTFRPEPTWSAKTTQRELQRFAADLENSLKAGTLLTKEEAASKARRDAAEAAKIQTLREYVTRVWMPQKKASVSENTVKIYELELRRRIYPALGECLLTEITPAQITALFFQIHDAGYSPKTLGLERTILEMVFRSAMQDDLIEYSPMLKARYPKASKDTAQTEQEKPLAYTADELRKILAAIEQEPLLWRCVVLLIASTGIPQGRSRRASMGLCRPCNGSDHHPAQPSGPHGRCVCSHAQDGPRTCCASPGGCAGTASTTPGATASNGALVLLSGAQPGTDSPVHLHKALCADSTAL